MIFLGCLFDRAEEKKLLNFVKIGIANAANTFQWNLIDGLNKVSEKPVNIVNVLPVGTFPQSYKKIFLETKKWSYMGSSNIEIGGINLPFLKQSMRLNKLKKVLKNTNDKEILIYSTYMPFLKAVSKLDKSYTITLIVTDLPEFYDFAVRTAMRRFWRKLNNKIIYKALGRVDKFVLLADAMKTPMKVNDRPYVVVEGIANPSDLPDVKLQKNGKKTIFYAGSLRKRFGIDTLLEAFAMTDNEDYELWLCGKGDMEDEIIAMSEKDKRVRYFGYCTKQQVAEMQQQATVLVNPRNNKEEFTKYSFPSKTIEYMVAGKPVLMYKLDGIPDEYDEYLHYVKGDTPADFKLALCKLLDKSEEELEMIGKKTREWVLEEKNNEKQAKKIIRMIFNEKN